MSIYENLFQSSGLYRDFKDLSNDDIDVSFSEQLIKTIGLELDEIYEIVIRMRPIENGSLLNLICMFRFDSFHEICLNHAKSGREIPEIGDAVKNYFNDISCTFSKKCSCLSESIKNNHMICFENFLSDHRWTELVSGPAWACAFGRLEMLKRFTDINSFKFAAESAARYGHLDCLKYVLELKDENLIDLIRVAAQGGRLNVLEYLFRLDADEAAVKTLKFPRTPLEMALEPVPTHLLGIVMYSLDDVNKISDYMDVLKFLRKRGFEWEGTEFRDVVLETVRKEFSITLKIIEFMHDNGYQFTTEDVKSTIMHDNLRILEYLFSIGVPKPPRMLDFVCCDTSKVFRYLKTLE
jgi:hypothetical protein